jgi:hypothetical protein
MIRLWRPNGLGDAAAIPDQTAIAVSADPITSFSTGFRYLMFAGAAVLLYGAIRRAR